MVSDAAALTKLTLTFLGFVAVVTTSMAEVLPGAWTGCQSLLLRVGEGVAMAW